jgi:hypothetical protein
MLLGCIAGNDRDLLTDGSTKLFIRPSKQKKKAPQMSASFAVSALVAEAYSEI